MPPVVKPPPNPSAFPCVESYSKDGQKCFVGTEGMALRDYFAAKVLAGCMAQPPVLGDWLGPGTIEEFYSALAYRYADAMLAERTKKKET